MSHKICLGKKAGPVPNEKDIRRRWGGGGGGVGETVGMRSVAQLPTAADNHPLINPVGIAVVTAIQAVLLSAGYQPQNR